MKKLTVIILANRVLDGQVWARAAQIEAGTFRVITPRNLDTCRGMDAQKLYVVGQVPLFPKQFETIEGCFTRTRRGHQFKISPVGDRN